MKLDRLVSTLPTLAQEAGMPVRHAADEGVLRVNPMAGLEGDRERSLQQELAQVAPEATGEFHGTAHILDDARQLAVALIEMGTAADALIQHVHYPHAAMGVDDEA